jgi:hypothetical protein
MSDRLSGVPWFPVNLRKSPVTSVKVEVGLRNYTIRCL